ncbi:DNA polymerase gamma [Spathaspora sp. JA1]|nr:DNA polymerase gamma [Spathaspora sp. JA1]
MRAVFQEEVDTTVASKEEPRVNQLGIQYLSKDMHKKLFPNTSSEDYLKPKHPELIDISMKHLDHNELLGKKTQITDPISIKNFPDLVGDSLDEHFSKLAQRSLEPYLSMCEEFLTSEQSGIPPKPDSKDWIFQSGWTRYAMDGSPPEQVAFPLENELVFDVEVIYKISQYPVMATCASSKAWYGWVSPVLVDIGKTKRKLQWEHLIPMNCMEDPKLIIGYNVSYDRARIQDEYNIKQSKAFYLDGMSLHAAVSGICSQQRPKWQIHKKNKKVRDEGEYEENGTTLKELEKQINKERELDPWLNKGSPNGLANVAEFHCGIKMDKTDRDYFGTEDPQEVVDNFNKLMDYCARDVEATYIVTKKLFPKFRERVPHPVSFAALRHMGTLILPTTTKWNKYLESADAHYFANRNKITESLRTKAVELVEYLTKEDDSLIPDYKKDPWLNQLNWEIKEERLKKDGTPCSRQAYLTGFPEWYRDLFRTKEKGAEEREMNLTLRTRTAPLFLRLKWEGYPIFWSDKNGWCFKVPFDEEIKKYLEGKNYTEAKLTPEEYIEYDDLLRDDSGMSYTLFKIPHPDGAGKRCTSVLSKNFIQFFENGTLTSEFEYAKEIMTLNNEASYWMGNRNRIREQFVVYGTQFSKNKQGRRDYKDKEIGIIIPILATMGTVTRRASENTWLTASNAKKNRIGSELKSLIEAPPGYCFVGADVDSEELWIASLVGDSMFQIHGGTALGWMTLEGEKSQKTDLHSKTANILGISRNHAKVFNYGRIYGAGVKFATRLLKQFNTEINDHDAEMVAKQLYASTKGEKKRLYYGGSESIMFNALEDIACQDEPRTPVLGACITDALNAHNLKKNSYMTSRVNWTIQSSGVDYLHLLIVAMEYLMEEYKVDGRLMITVHDELRYLVKEKDKYKAALLLQISNVWTRAMFCEQLGIKEVPQSCAFFSEVDIDHVLRKEVGMDCVTPSNPNAIPPGESWDIRKLLDKCDQGAILENPQRLNIDGLKYIERSPVIYELDKDLDMNVKIAKIKLQTSTNEDEFKENNIALSNLKRSSKYKAKKNHSTEKKVKYAKKKGTSNNSSNSSDGIKAGASTSSKMSNTTEATEYRSKTKKLKPTANSSVKAKEKTASKSRITYRKESKTSNGSRLTKNTRASKPQSNQDVSQLSTSVTLSNTTKDTIRNFAAINSESGGKYMKEKIAGSSTRRLGAMDDTTESKVIVLEPSIDELYASSKSYDDYFLNEFRPHRSSISYIKDSNDNSTFPYSQHYSPYRRADSGPSSKFTSSQ